MLVDAGDFVALQPVRLIHRHVQRQADREVGFEGGVHRHENAFGRFVQRGGGRDDAVEHRLAVFGFADLEEGRLRGGFDEVARRIDLEQAHALALDLAAEDHGYVEVHAGSLERFAVALVHVAHGSAQHTRGVKHALGVPDGDRFAAIGVFELLDLQDFADRLGDREVARREQAHEAVARLLVDDHFPKGADLVQARVGARVGEEDEPGVEFDGDAVSHVVWLSFLSW